MRLYDWLKKLNLIDKTWIDPEVDTGTNIVNPKSVTAMGHFCNVNCKISVIKMTKKRDSLDPSPGPQLVYIGPGPQVVFTSSAQCCTTTTTIPQLLVLSFPLPPLPSLLLLLLLIIIILTATTRDSFSAAKSVLNGP